MIKLEKENNDMISFDEFFQQFCAEYDEDVVDPALKIWNMGDEDYKHLRKQAYEIYKTYIKSEIKESIQIDFDQNEFDRTKDYYVDNLADDIYEFLVEYKSSVYNGASLFDICMDSFITDRYNDEESIASSILTNPDSVRNTLSICRRESFDNGYDKLGEWAEELIDNLDILVSFIRNSYTESFEYSNNVDLNNLWCVLAEYDLSDLPDDAREELGTNFNGKYDYSILISFEANSKEDATNKSRNLIEDAIQEDKEILNSGPYSEGPSEEDISIAIMCNANYFVVSAEEAIHNYAMTEDDIYRSYFDLDPSDLTMSSLSSYFANEYVSGINSSNWENI